jgi:hypothetical protein
VNSVIRSYTAFKIVSSDTFLSISSSIGMIDLTSKSSESTTNENLPRSPNRISRRFSEGKCRTIERFCRAGNSLNARFLKTAQL